MDGSKVQREHLDHNDLLPTEKSRIKVSDGRPAVIRDYDDASGQCISILAEAFEYVPQMLHLQKGREESLVAEVSKG